MENFFITQLQQQGFSVLLLVVFGYISYTENAKLKAEIKELREKYEEFMQNVNEELKDVVQKNTAILEKVSDFIRK